MKYILLIPALMAIFQSCDLLEEKACSLEIRSNVYVAGKYENDSSYSFIRITDNNLISDTLQYSMFFPEVRFTERKELQRVFVAKNNINIDSSDWFQQEEENDGCHMKEKTITFD